MIITVVLVVLVLAAVGYVLVSRIAGRPVNTRRLLVLPGVLTAMGALQLAGAVSAGIRPQDLGLLAVGLAAAAGLGAARGATVAVSVRDGRPWLRYRAVTLALWAATVAVRVGLTVLAHAGRGDGLGQRAGAAALGRRDPARRRRRSWPTGPSPRAASSGRLGWQHSTPRCTEEPPMLTHHHHRGPDRPLAPSAGAAAAGRARRRLVRAGRPPARDLVVRYRPGGG